MKYTFTTFDEEFSYASRIASHIEDTLEEMQLDTTNKQYVITIEIEEANQ